MPQGLNMHMSQVNSFQSPGGLVNNADQLLPCGQSDQNEQLQRLMADKN